MPGATTLPDGLMVTTYRIPRNAEMLAHRSRTAVAGTYRPKDYVSILSEKAVTYTDADVFLNPVTGKLTDFERFGLAISDYFLEEQHWGFRLPKNAKDVLFVLVHRQYVMTTRSHDPQKTTDWMISTSQMQHFNDLMERILKIEGEREKILQEKVQQTDLYDSMQCVRDAHEQMADVPVKQVDQKIMTMLPDPSPTKVIITP